MMAVTRVERAREEYVEAVVADALVDNWYRLSRYSTPEEARPAIDNVAREIRERLTGPVLA